MDAKVARLSRFPHSGRVVPELQRIGVLRIRELVMGSYRVFYEIDEVGILIVAVFDARRDLDEAIFSRLLEMF